MKTALILSTLLLASTLTSGKVSASDEMIFTPKHPVSCKSPQNANQLVVALVDASISTVGDTSTIEILWNKGRCKDIVVGKGGTSFFNNTITVYGKTTNGLEAVEDLEAVTKKIANGKYAQTKIKFNQSLLEVTDQLELYVYNGLMGPARFSLKLVKNESGVLLMKINSL